MDSSELGERIGGLQKARLLVQYLTNLPCPLTPEELEQMCQSVGSEGCARLHVASQNGENLGRTTVRFSSVPNAVSGEFPNILEDPTEVANIAGFILGLKRGNTDFAILESFVEEHFASGVNPAEGRTIDIEAAEDGGGEMELSEEDCTPLNTGTNFEEAEAEEELAQTDQHLEEIQSELKRVRELATHNEQELRQANDDLAFLKDAKQTSLQTLEEVRQEVEKLENKIIEDRKTLADLRAESASLEEQVHNIELEALNAEQAAAEKMGQSKARLQAAEEANAQADLFLNKAEQLEADATEKMQEAEARLEAARSDMAEAESQKRAESQESFAIISQMDEIGIDEELREKLKPQVDEAVRYQAAIYTLAIIKTSAEKLAGQVRDEVRDLAAECGELGERRSNLHSKIAVLESSCATLMAEKDSLVNRSGDLEKEILSLEADIAEKEKNLDQARQESRAVNTTYHDTLAKYREATEDKNHQIAEAEENFERQQAAQEQKIHSFEQMTAQLISDAQAKLQEASKSCADRVAKLEAEAIRAQEKADRESAKLEQIIAEAEAALIAMRQNAEHRVSEAHQKALALNKTVQAVQEQNLSSLQEKMEEMKRFQEYFIVSMDALSAARALVNEVYEQSDGLTKTYQSLYEMRQKEAEDIEASLKQSLALVDEICQSEDLLGDESLDEDDLELIAEPHSADVEDEGEPGTEEGL